MSDPTVEVAVGRHRTHSVKTILDARIRRYTRIGRGPFLKIGRQCCRTGLKPGFYWNPENGALVGQPEPR